MKNKKTKVAKAYSMHNLPIYIASGVVIKIAPPLPYMFRLRIPPTKQPRNYAIRYAIITDTCPVLFFLYRYAIKVTAGLICAPVIGPMKHIIE